MLKITTATLVLITLFYGIFSFNKTACIETVNKITTNTSFILSHTDTHADDCHSDNSKYHTCHLGHCAYTFSNSLNFIIQLPNIRFLFNESSYMASTDLVILIRPPIS